ncbi:MAG: hypothetical protein ACRDZO_26250 [Egibacteraceae bacterium]
MTTPCDDVGSNTARGGHGGGAVTAGVGKPDKPDKPGDKVDKPVDKGDDGKGDGAKDDGKGDGNGKGDGKKDALAETGRASVPLALVALVALILGAGLVGAARRFDRRSSLTAR